MPAPIPGTRAGSGKREGRTFIKHLLLLGPLLPYALQPSFLINTLMAVETPWRAGRT